MSHTGELVVSFLGWSGSGKTTFIEDCIKGLTKRGLKVGALKSTHREVGLDFPGTDSYRFRSAGAVEVCLLAANGSALFCSSGEMDRGDFPRLFKGADIILAEGYHGSSDLRFEVFRRGFPSQDMKIPKEQLDGVITEDDETLHLFKELGKPAFSPARPEEFFVYLLSRILRR
ncbi:MAG: molybdopterin-guanine dinucleotide biosynthesis protein B [Spirochaetales bacterium]|nr:molybdopterin-guanine dinucleotide biosynthesis protein B [Spirochaetales bacterium]